MRAGFHEKFISVYLHSAVVCKPTGMRVAGPFFKRCIVTPRMYQPGFAVYIELGIPHTHIGLCMAWTKEQLADHRWQEVRRHILQRDERTCRYCGEINKPLHVHHIRYIEGREPWEYCQQDLVALCEDCHSQNHKTIKLYFDAKLNTKMWIWRELLRNAPKVKRLIEHDVFVIIENTESSEYCTIIHVPSFKCIDFPLPADIVHEKMKREPDSLSELKKLIREGASGFQGTADA
jgi:hypothetical protein